MKDDLQMQDETQDASTPEAALGKKPFVEPKLTYVQPKLKEHGGVDELTQQTTGFFGSFSP